VAPFTVWVPQNLSTGRVAQSFRLQPVPDLFGKPSLGITSGLLVVQPKPVNTAPTTRKLLSRDASNNEFHELFSRSCAGGDLTKFSPFAFIGVNWGLEINALTIEIANRYSPATTLYK
jgi:hypothetical protein